MKNKNLFEKDFEEFVENLPEPIRLEKYPIQKPKQSCFVGISGFETRCYAIARDLSRKGFETDFCIMVNYSQVEMKEKNATNKDTLFESMQNISRKNTPIELDHNDHSLKEDFGKTLLDKLTLCGINIGSNDSHVFFDITVGSSRLLLEGLHALINTNVNLTLLYSEVKNYRPFFDEYQVFFKEDKQKGVSSPEFLSTGIEKIDLLNSIPGRFADGRPTALIVFPSFTPLRIGAVIDDMSPNLVHWVFGIPHLVSNRWRIKAQETYHQSLIRQLHSGDFVSTFDYRETLWALNNFYLEQKQDFNILICSLGSKLQKVGQVLFHILRPEVGAVVSIPKVWDTNRHDETVRSIYAVPLGNCDKLRENLIKTKTFSL